jgi:hypothetical protein
VAHWHRIAWRLLRLHLLPALLLLLLLLLLHLLHLCCWPDDHLYGIAIRRVARLPEQRCSVALPGRLLQ